MKQYMNTTKPKKEYVTPTCEVVMLGHQSSLLDDNCDYNSSGCMPMVIMCGSQPCKW